MSKYLIKISGVTPRDGAGEYDGGDTLAAAKRRARKDFVPHVPHGDIAIYTVTRDGGLKWAADVQSWPMGGRPESAHSDLTLGGRPAGPVVRRDLTRPRNKPSSRGRDVGGWFRRAYTEVKTGIGKGVARSIARRIVKDFDEGEDFDPGEIAKRYRVSSGADVAILQILRALEKRAHQCPTEKCIDSANGFATTRIEEAITRHGKARDHSSRDHASTPRRFVVVVKAHKLDSGKRFASQYNAGTTLAEARKEADFWARNTPMAEIEIHVIEGGKQRRLETAYGPRRDVAQRSPAARRDPARKLTRREVNDLRSISSGFGPLSYRERDLAKKFIAMGLLKTPGNGKDPAYIILTAAGHAALDNGSERDPLLPRHPRTSLDDYTDRVVRGLETFGMSEVQARRAALDCKSVISVARLIRLEKESGRDPASRRTGRSRTLRARTTARSRAKPGGKARTTPQGRRSERRAKPTARRPGRRVKGH